MAKTLTHKEREQIERFEIQRQKKIYYDSDKQLTLPRHSRTYYDCYGHHAKDIPIEGRILDLGFLVHHGFDLHESVRKYKEDRPESITSCIPQTFEFYIVYMRYGETLHFINSILNKLSETEIIQLFIDEVKLRYNDVEFRVKMADWKDEKLIEMSNGDKATFNRLITTTELTKQIV
jgi:hypothetical protein